MHRLINSIIRNIHFIFFRVQLFSNPLLKKQISNPLTIPIIIINYNQLFYLKQLIHFLEKRKFENIIIIDNGSTYSPLLDFYEEIKEKITVELMNENFGHMVFFENKKLQKKYGRGYYFLTDADVIPNNNLPENFPLIMISHLKKYFKVANKVGFALDISDIPNEYPAKQKVLNWEKKYWIKQIEKDVYRANIDTTFALYKPKFPKNYNFLEFISGIRLAGNFLAKHGGWYSNPKNLSDEEKYYIQQKNKSSTWKLNEKGAHESATHLQY